MEAAEGQKWRCSLSFTISLILFFGLHNVHIHSCMRVRDNVALDMSISDAFWVRAASFLLLFLENACVCVARMSHTAVDLIP